MKKRIPVSLSTELHAEIVELEKELNISSKGGVIGFLIWFYKNKSQ